mmetsp:Transcript_9269/g.38991  ORF Transcript_9269/g.38991 Transcript_9269/m.38991 type:complete len:205 (+) Transcript_9269:1464-2078(+)
MGSHACEGSTASRPGVCLGVVITGLNRFISSASGCRPPQYPNRACQQYTCSTPKLLMRATTSAKPSLPGLRRFRFFVTACVPRVSLLANLTLASIRLTRWLKHDSVETAARIAGLSTPCPRNLNQRHDRPRYGLECTPCQYADSNPEAIPVATNAAARIGHHAFAGSLGTGMCACFAATCAATKAVAMAFSMRSLPRCTSVDAK